MVEPSRKFTAGTGYRYGFNGKEKDNSTGEGNLDFGARIYDGRLGRWLSVDPLASKYTGLSPYNYCLNNPIVYIDSKGEFVIDPAFKIAYPTVALLLENADKIYYHMELPADVKKALEGIDYNKVFNDLFVANFKEISTGSDDEIREMLTKDKGPTVQAYNSRPSEIGEETVNGETQRDNSKGLNNIIMSPEIAGVLEFEIESSGGQSPVQGLGGHAKDDGDRQVAFKIFFATLFHEGVHWIRTGKGKNENIIYNGSPRDPGKVFEIKTFGRDQGRLRVKDLFSGGKHRTQAESDKFNYNTDPKEEENSHMEKKDKKDSEKNKKTPSAKNKVNITPKNDKLGLN